ncbi:MAG: glycosyltransferase family 2 protein [Pseudomonadota bacterium]
MSVIASQRMRRRRARWLLRAIQKRRDLRPVRNRTGAIRADDLLAISTVRNELAGLPAFLDHYRRIGIGQFLFVDNGSTDGTGEFLADQPDVSLWHADGRYGAAAFGVDWTNWLLNRYGHGHWCLSVDADEFLVYPFHDTRPLRALTDWLDARRTRSFGAMLLDLYPSGPIGATPSTRHPFEIPVWFDGGNYTVERNDPVGNLWIQGGVRARCLFADQPEEAPALNKVPLVRWRRGYVHMSSTHMLLPRGLNRTYDAAGGERTTGILLHAKFLGPAREDGVRSEHYRQGSEHRRHAAAFGSELRCAASERYDGWRCLVGLGLMSKGNWA